MTTPDPTLAAGAVLERQRIAAIVALPEAKGREAAALALALNSDMSPEACGSVLAGLPREGAGDGGRDPHVGLAFSYVDGPLSPEQIAAETNAGPSR